jgi:hypothetical protein
VTDVVAKITAYYERRLTPEEVRAYLDAPVSEFEREEAVALIRWFRRRYPTPAERLAYGRRTYKRWNARRGIALRQSKG